MLKKTTFLFCGISILVLFLAACTTTSDAPSVELTDEQVEDIVRRSYQYVALYNVINKAALDLTNPGATGGLNKMNVATTLFDHNVKMIARPNNDTLYINCLMDLRKDPVLLDIPALESKYVSLMAVAYDHYVNVPLATRLGDFRKPEKLLFYSARTEAYNGEAVEGVDRTFEMTGDFVIVVFRVMPHAVDPSRRRFRHTESYRTDCIPEAGSASHHRTRPAQA